MSDDKDLDIPEIPFQDNSPSTYYNYRCQRCAYSEGVEDFIVDEFGYDEETSSWQMPEIECPQCGGVMIHDENKKDEE
ncbi:MAG: hypothetical protein SCK29_02790 [Bacillota bacterium]|nr:hypothetical protein [Bacillota bacterium]MDW7683029.1 hypothetical protein [Bacillota bacterium]